MASSKRALRPELRAAVRRSALESLEPDATVAVALSGGIDSIVLLDLLAALGEEMPIRLSAIHVNHGLSPNAHAWEQFCAAECARRRITFESAQICLDVRAEQGLEAGARTARYAAIGAVAARQNIATVALAHHQDDQAETVLLQLLRGAAPAGLAAMPERRVDRAGIQYWRPLLGVSRRLVADYAMARGLVWIEDESNADVRFKRNYLRHHVLPALAGGFDNYRTGLSRAAQRAAEAAQLGDALADIDTRQCAGTNGLLVPKLQALGALRSRNAIRRMLATQRFWTPDADRLAEFVRQAFVAGPGRHPSLPLDARHRLCATRGEIKVLPAALALAFDEKWNEEREIVLPHGVLRFERSIGTGIAAAAVPEGGFGIRPRIGGELCRVAANRPRRTLKNLLLEAGIAAPLRRDWPLIVDNVSLVAVPGIAVGVDWQCPPDRPGWTVAWIPAGT